MTDLSRRRFLMAVGAAGGAGAVVGALELFDRGDGGSAPFRPPRSADFAAPGSEARPSGVTPFSRPDGAAFDGRAPSVLVLGAGVAGLCCAYELEKAGYAVTVVEARERVGGRNWTVRGGDRSVDTRGAEQECRFAEGRWLNAGPARIAQHHTTLDYCRELGVPVEVFVNANPDAWVEVDGVRRRVRAARADIDGYVAEILTKAVDCRFLEDEITREECFGLVDHLRSLGALAGPDRGYDERPGVGLAGGVIGEPDDLATLLELGLHQRFVFERDWHQAMPMFHPVGGMDAIPRALAGALRSPVRMGVKVRQVASGPSSISAIVEGPEGGMERIEADYGICTLPPHLASVLPADWGRPVEQALAAPTPFPTGKIGLEYERRFWEEDEGIFGGITATDQDVRVIWYPSTGYLGSGGVVVGAYPFGLDAERFGGLPHGEREELALVAGEAIHGPPYRKALRSSFSVDWPTQPYSQGAWSDWPSYDDDLDLLVGPAGRWWFAGDWLSRAVGWQHGAFESARHTVVGLHEQAVTQQ